MTEPQPKPWIEAIAAYVPGRATAAPGQRVYKLSSNENPLGPSPKALEAMQKTLGKSARYPDGASHDLRAALAEVHGIEMERIVCGTGSDELLQLLAQAYASHGDEVLYVRHGFMVYPIAAQRAGATPVAAPDHNYTADVDALLAAVNPRTRLVYLANPNNPTSTVIGRSEVLRLHAGLPKDVLLVLDAAYAEYIDDPDYEDGIALARIYPNVVTTRTFSKIYGLAAERVGWAYGSPRVIATLNRIRAPFNVTTSGSAGAIAALQDTPWLDHCRAENSKWRTWLVREMEGLGNKGINIVPSAANFILATFPTTGPLTAEKVNEALMAQGIIVRWLPNQGLGHALRISIGNEEETRFFASALRQIVEKAG